MKDTDNTFKWTPEFENEFVKWCKKNKYNNLLDAFIKSKQPPLSKDKERIEVSHFAMHDNLEGNGSDSFWYQFCTSKYLMSKGYKNIEQAIEAALNEDTVVGKFEWTDKIVVDILNTHRSSDYILAKMTYDLDTVKRWKDVYAKYYQLSIPEKTDTVVEDKTWWQKLGIKFDGKWYTHPRTNTYDNLDQVIEELHLATKEKKYTQSEVDAIREETWKAARLTHPLAGMKFDTQQDYINFINSDAHNKPYTGKESSWVFCSDCKNKQLCSFRGKCDKSGKDSKEWEIVSYQENDAAKTIWTVDKVVSDTWKSKFQDAQYWCNTSPTIGNTKFTIHSVKRLSDNTVFSVGSEWDNCKIVSFKLSGNDIEVYFSNDVPSMDLMFLTPPKPTPEKTVTDNSDVACLSITDIKEVMPKYTYELFKKDFENKLTQKLKTHTP